jgi:RES domain-containing protein
MYRVTLTLDEKDILKQCIDDGDADALQEATTFFEIEDLDLLALLDDPFKPKPVNGKPFPESRFSNGDHPVFYSAQEQETACKEYAHHAPRYGIPKAMGIVSLKLHLIDCRVRGMLGDLRPLIDDFPYLIGGRHDSCHDVGARAVAQNTDGLLASSVRHTSGTNGAIFKRSCLSEPQKIGTVVCTVDPVAKNATCTIAA